MTDREALMAAIIANPEDDTLCLAFADWCDENGEPDRAEFVRLQCALDAGDPFAPGRRPLLLREWNLIRRQGERWIRGDGLADVIEPASLWHCPPKTRFRRGFIDHACFQSPAAFLRDAPGLLARAPVTGITLRAPYEVPAERQQWFQNTFFTVYGRRHAFPMPTGEPHGDEFPAPDEFRQLVGSPEFARLRSFALGSLYADRRHIEILTSGPAAAGLRELDLSGNPCVVGGDWAALASSPALSGLRSLLLDDCFLGEDGLATVVNARHLANLERLSLNAAERSAVGPEGVRLICDSAALPRLSELNLCGQAGGSEGLRALAGWQGLASLTRLDLSYFYSEGDEEDDVAEAWAAFARSPHWGRLRELNLEGDYLENLKAILDSPNLATLRILTFDAPFCRYGADGEVERCQDEAADRLARCPHLADGLELRIPGEGLSESGRRLLQDRFGDGLVVYPSVAGSYRQPGDWASGRPSRAALESEEDTPGS